MTQNPEQKQSAEIISENKGLTPEEFNQLANLGLGKVYFCLLLKRLQWIVLIKMIL